LSISGPIDRSPNAYDLAFAHKETDAGDLTYFVDHPLNLMGAALQDLLDPLTHRAARLRELTDLVASFDKFNHRQRSLLEHATGHPAEDQTYEGHARSHRVHYLTARQDVCQLGTRACLCRGESPARGASLPGAGVARCDVRKAEDVALPRLRERFSGP
jgi:hypothetical protein